MLYSGASKISSGDSVCKRGPSVYLPTLPASLADRKLHDLSLSLFSYAPGFIYFTLSFFLWYDNDTTRQKLPLNPTQFT